MCAFVPCLLPVPVQMFFQRVFLFGCSEMIRFSCSKMSRVPQDPTTPLKPCITPCTSMIIHAPIWGCIPPCTLCGSIRTVLRCVFRCQTLRLLRAWGISCKSWQFTRLCPQLTTDLSLFVKSSTDVGQTYGPNYAELQLCWQRRFLHIHTYCIKSVSICMNYYVHLYIIM